MYIYRLPVLIESLSPSPRLTSLKRTKLGAMSRTQIIPILPQLMAPHQVINLLTIQKSRVKKRLMSNPKLMTSYDYMGVHVGSVLNIYLQVLYSQRTSRLVMVEWIAELEAVSVFSEQENQSKGNISLMNDKILRLVGYDNSL